MAQRRWISFDQTVTDREFLSIPQPDRGLLKAAMKAYRLDAGSGYEVESYGEGLKRIRRSGRSQGRCLFFAVVEQGGVETLVALLFYKKESMKAPAKHIETARKRMREFRRE